MNIGTVVNKKTLAWAFYDWANSAYTTIVITTFFPLLFGSYWFTSENTTTPLGMANSIASVTIVVLAPVLGAIADRGGMKKRFLMAFLTIGVLFVCALSFVDKGNWQLALVTYVLSFIGFAGANVFYDSMLVDIAPKEKLDMSSALGFSLGYLGGGIALLGCVIYTEPMKFGLQHTTSVDQLVLLFMFVGIWWALFSLPLLMVVKEKPVAMEVSLFKAIGQGFGQLIHTFREIRKLKVVFTFLLAYWFYIDGVDTIIAMATNYGQRLNINKSEIVMALLLTQFVAFPAAIIYGKLGEKFGAKGMLLIAIVVYIGVTVYAYYMDSARDFYVLAIIVGLFMGGIQSLSRSLYARLIPANKAAEFFGFYNMLGKLAAFLGPLLMAVVSGVTGSPRLSILSIIGLFILGAILLSTINIRAGEQMAKELEKI